MQIVWMIGIGILGGVLGGMGMGGGTLLIPLLTLLMGTEQKIAQAINLVAFIPMSVVTFIMHAKNKLIRFEYLWLSLPALVGSVGASLLALKAAAGGLRIGFGVFLIALGVFQLTSVIVKKVAENRKQVKKNISEDWGLL